jgi:hypothetical protein
MRLGHVLINFKSICVDMVHGIHNNHVVLVASMTYRNIDDIFLLTLMVPKVIGFVALGVGCVLGFNQVL